MSNANYQLTYAAEMDLREVIRYSRKQWGAAQMSAYIERLEVGIKRLALGQGGYKTLDDVYLGLRVAHCEHHYLFLLSREKAPALVIAIFHERMDLMARLRARLS